MKNGCTEDGENVGPLLCKRVCRITRIGALCTPSETIPPMVVIPRYPFNNASTWLQTVSIFLCYVVHRWTEYAQGIVNGLKRTKMKKVRFEYYLEFFLFLRIDISFFERNRFRVSFRNPIHSSVVDEPKSTNKNRERCRIEV